MSRTSALTQWTGLPVLGDAADITAVGTTMADQIEKYVMMRFATAAARDALITSPEQGMHAYLSTPKVDTWYDGTAWRGEWVTTFVPQVDQGATTNIAKTVNFCQYRYDGPMIDFLATLTVTGAGTITNAVSITVPVAIINFSQAIVGASYCFDASAGTGYVTSPTGSTSTVITFASDATNGVFGTNPNIALANGDQLRIALRYRWV